jgi:hypothetical protein
MNGSVSAVPYLDLNQEARCALERMILTPPSSAAISARKSWRSGVGETDELGDEGRALLALYFEGAFGDDAGAVLTDVVH